MPIDSPSTRTARDAAALAALTSGVMAECALRLVHATGTHGLLLRGVSLAAPTGVGIACWAALTPDLATPGWRGALHTDAAALPFVDGAFCAVLACFSGAAGLACVGELARVLAPHGMLLVADVHPRSLWRAGVAPHRWELQLRRAGLDVRSTRRCGAPWPRARGGEGLPRWLSRVAGGAWIVEARHSVLATLPLRHASARRALEHNALLPGARRECA